jgi:hypothetical protein
MATLIATMLEYAILMTNEELSNYFERIYAAYRDKKGKAVPILEAKERLLLQEYDKIEEACREEYRQRLRELLHKKLFFDKKTCMECQAKLRLVQSTYGEFYGCPNYRDGRKHTTFQGNFEAQFPDNFRAIKVRIPSDWLTEMLKSTLLHPQVAASDLLDFLLAKGYEDLREKYGWTNTKTRISGYVQAKKESSREEQEIHAFLVSFFPKVASQQGIRYKFAGEKERTAILDTIASTTSQVFLIEIKRNVNDIKEDQLTLYQHLLQHILQQVKDTRTVSSLFLIYNTPEFVPGSHYPNYLLFDTLKQAMQLTEVLSLFEQSIFFTSGDSTTTFCFTEQL